MKRTGPVVFALVLVVLQSAFGSDRKLVAEGDYSAQVQDHIRPLSHWKLWHLSDGGYEVVDSSTNSSSVQRFRFDAHFAPIGYSKEQGPVVASIPNLPQVPGFSVACEYKTKELRCDADWSDGRKSSASIPAQSPYVVIGEFYDLDVAWFMTSVVHLASSRGAKDGVVNVYALTGGTKPYEIGLKADRPMKVTFVKEEAAEVSGKTQLVKEYRSNLGVFRESAQGLVVSVSKGAEHSGFVVANYKEYEAFAVPSDGAPLSEGITAMPTESDAVPDSATASQERRMQVSGGVMQGLLVHRVAPIYPDSAKQSGIQGKVVLEATISAEGNIVDLKPVSGPTELIAAAIAGVQQWKYKPYRVSGQPVEVEISITVDFMQSTER